MRPAILLSSLINAIVACTTLLLAELALGEINPSTYLSASDQQKLNSRLTELAALEFCNLRLTNESDSNGSLEMALSYVRRNYTMLTSATSTISKKNVIQLAKIKCPYIFNPVIALPKPKPFTTTLASPPQLCNLDSFWINKLFQSGSLYLEGKNCTIDLRIPSKNK